MTSASLLVGVILPVTAARAANEDDLSSGRAISKSEARIAAGGAGLGRQFGRRLFRLNEIIWVLTGPQSAHS